MTEEEYLLFEEQSNERHEYYGGEIFAMAGGSIDHARIIQNASRAVGNALSSKRCEVFGSDLRIQIEAFGLYTYPDVSIVCGDPDRYKGRKDTITNPVVIIEVLSPDTASYDRGEKLASTGRSRRWKNTSSSPQQKCRWSITAGNRADNGC